MKMYFIDFFFIQNSLLFVIIVTCNFFNMTIKILITNAIYN